MQGSDDSVRATSGESRWKLGKLELAVKKHPDFETDRLTDGREHAGEALAAWNHALGISPMFRFQGNERINEFVPAVKQWGTRNTALVAESHGYTELHAMLASVCPEKVLDDHGLKRTDANFQLWPFTVEAPSRAAFATAAAGAFSDFVWERLIRRSGTSRSDMARDSSIRLLIDDSTVWMKALYGVALDRLDRLPTDRPPAPDLNQVFSEFVLELARGEGGIGSPRIQGGTLKGVGAGGRPFSVPLASLHLPELGLTLTPRDSRGGLATGGSGHRVIWDPFDPADREAVVEEMLAQPDVMDSVRPVLECLRRETLPEDFPDKRFSRLKEDMERRLYRRRAKRKVAFGETVDDVAVYDADEPLLDGDDVLRGVTALLDERENKILVLLRLGRTQSKIAKEVNLKSHSQVSRIISQMEAVLRRHLQLRKRG